MKPVTEQNFEQLVRQYERLVYTICYQMTHNPHTAQDLAQEAFLSAYTHRDSCDEENIKPWLCRIATNKAKDFLKSAYNRKVDLTDDDEDVHYSLYATPPPEDITIEQDQLRLITDTIYHLKEPYLKVSVCYFLEEKSVEEIALLLHRPPKTVHTQLYRAKLLLQKDLIQGGITRGAF
ncbi:MAG: RNA polymerase sigma factor [Pygmaiobacter sp.]